MTIVVNKETGEVFYGSVTVIEPKENEVHIELEKGFEYNFVKGFYNFETQEFYETFKEEDNL
jgi:formylmethanofuran dehydrogenase subunit A